MTSPAPPPGTVPRRVAGVLLALTALLLGALAVLGHATWRLATADVRLEQLSEDERIRLLQEGQRIAPPVYQHFLGSGDPGFYTLQPRTRYDRSHPAAGPAGVLGDEFTTNDLGFRGIETPKRPGVRRIVIAGDSWTFGPAVKREETFTHQLQTLLAETRPAGAEEWEVYNLGVMGWNTRNTLTALQILEERLQPDLVVVCPTSNDIDASFEVWNGRLVNSGFQSLAIFRNSYEYERRWVESLRAIQQRLELLAARGVPSFVYFLAEWRELAPYYAKLADFTLPYTVVPTALIVDPYRLSVERDAGRHANAEGHRGIARYLYDALVAQGLVGAREPLGGPYPVRFPGREVDADVVRAEFDMWQGVGLSGDLIPLDQNLMGREALFSLERPRDATTLEVELELVDAAGLYPLEVEVSIPAPEPARVLRRVEAYHPESLRIELAIPPTLAAYDRLDLRLRFDRVVSRPWSLKPRSLARPRVRFY